MPAKNPKGTSFKVAYEGKPSEKIKLKAYAFDRNGNFLEEASSRGSEFNFKMSAKALKRSRVFISPVSPIKKDRYPTVGELERLKAYEPVFTIKNNLIEVMPIPGNLWPFWLWVRCRVRGKVVKPVSSDGTIKNFPVCGARVHICEVDKIRFLLPRIPDPIIFRLRDDLLKKPELNPVIPSPKPDPVPGALPIPIPKPIDPIDPMGPLDFLKYDGIDGEAIINPDSMKSVLPKALLALRDTRTKADLIKFDVPLVGNSKFDNPIISKTSRLPKLDEKVATGLMSNSANTIRTTILDNFQYLHPYFCLFPYFHKYFYTCQELAVIETDANGQFETYIWYQRFSDKPDLYFWVEYNIDGVWMPVYKPHKACATYWDYACGTEVTIRVTDPRVLICGELPTPTGLVVNIYKIGHSGIVSEISQDVNATSTINGVNQKNVGLTKLAVGDGQYKRPFAGSLGLVVHFGNQLRANNITHYRWSYKKVKDNNLVDLPDLVDGNPNPEKAWKVMTTPINMTYREEDRNSSPPKVSLKPYRLGPDPDFTEPLFKVPYRHPDLIPASELAPKANVDRDWVSLNFSSAVLNTNFDAESQPNEAAKVARRAELAGLYEFKLELFRIIGGVPTVVTLDKGAFQHPDPSDTSEFIGAPNGNLELVTGDDSKATAYKMYVRIDNNRCKADIKEVEVEGLFADPMCGFVKYQNKSQKATITFEASHSNGFARFSFVTVRGSGNVIHPATDTGHVITNSDNNDFTLAGGEFSAEITISDMLPTTCSQGAFAERLYVNALATNGSNTELNYLDASDLEAFALALKTKKTTGTTSVE
ncbi:MAG: hypothetical protein AAF502_00820 [Bacteroidota bacterium]